jgi:hypothetical protein
MAIFAAEAPLAQTSQESEGAELAEMPIPESGLLTGWQTDPSDLDCLPSVRRNREEEQ